MAMKMDFNLSQRLELKMKLAPQIIQSIEILQLPTLELLQRIKQERAVLVADKELWSVLYHRPVHHHAVDVPPVLGV